MVQLLDGRVISRPIAGTRRRGRTDEEDRRLAAELSEHPKEIAEHVMLVDLARNDVGRVVRFGTEQVDEMMTLERYSHVMHLTSQVSGELAEGATPDRRAAGHAAGRHRLGRAEGAGHGDHRRRSSRPSAGPYAGVVGYIDFSGNIDTAIAIRTMVVTADGRASVQAGAGVVADSVPEHEDLECHNKAQALLAAVPGARRMTEQRASTGRVSSYRAGVRGGALGHAARAGRRPHRGARPRRHHLPPGPDEPGRGRDGGVVVGRGVPAARAERQARLPRRGSRAWPRMPSS